MKKIIKPLLGIILIIIISVILVRYLTSQETLSDYAINHPDVAYPAASFDEAS
ncbi:MAG: hypothetical protein MJZ11_12010 [Lachnospiraceae bacterium]|nr:hypothetical protein [Lachnospiraceae bacterium]